MKNLSQILSLVCPLPISVPKSKLPKQIDLSTSLLGPFESILQITATVIGSKSSNGPKLHLEFSPNLHHGLQDSVWLSPCLFISCQPSSYPVTQMLFYFLQCDKLYSTSGSSHMLLCLLWEQLFPYLWSHTFPDPLW